MWRKELFESVPRFAYHSTVYSIGLLTSIGLESICQRIYIGKSSVISVDIKRTIIRGIGIALYTSITPCALFYRDHYYDFLCGFLPIPIERTIQIMLKYLK